MSFNGKRSGFSSCSSLSASATPRVCYSSCQWCMPGVRNGGARGGRCSRPPQMQMFGLAQQHEPVRGLEKGSHITLATNCLSAYFLNFSSLCFFSFSFPSVCISFLAPSYFSSLSSLGRPQSRNPAAGEVEHNLA